MELTIGKRRRLQQCSTPDGLFVVMALDHRDSLRRALNPVNPESIGYSEMVAFKLDVVSALAPVSTAVLLDPEFSAAQSIAGGVLPGRAGLLVAVEAAGQADEPLAHRPEVLEGWGVEKSARMGASAVKLRLPCQPEGRHATAQERLLDSVVAECRAHDIPLFLRLLPLAAGSRARKLSSAEKRAAVIETARRLTSRGIEVLATEFPLDTTEVPDEAAWAASCAELDEASQTPWVLLSGGVGFEAFARQTQIACGAGASGIVAGRTVWGEAAELRGEAALDFLNKTAVDRLVELGDIVAEYGAPWTQRYPASAHDVGESWYESY